MKIPSNLDIDIYDNSHCTESKKDSLPPLNQDLGDF